VFGLDTIITIKDLKVFENLVSLIDSVMLLFLIVVTY